MMTFTHARALMIQRSPVFGTEVARALMVGEAEDSGISEASVEFLDEDLRCLGEWMEGREDVREQVQQLIS